MSKATTFFAYCTMLVFLVGVEKCTAAVTTTGPTTTAAPVVDTPMYIGSHNYVYFVRPDGCYTIHLSTQQLHALKSHHDGHTMKAKLLEMVEHAVDRHEVDHHTLDAESHALQSACQELPVFRFFMA